MVYVSNQDKKMGSTFTTNNENAKAASVRGTNYSSGDPFGVFGLSQPGRPTPKVYKKPELIQFEGKHEIKREVLAEVANK